MSAERSHMTMGVLLPLVTVMILGQLAGQDNDTLVVSGVPVAFTAHDRSDIFSLSLATGTRKNLTHSDDLSEYDAAWSPDHTKLAFAAVADPYEARSDLYVLDIGSGARRKLTSVPMSHLCGSPTWSPDGKTILFHISQYSQFVGPGHSEIWSVDANGGLPKKFGEGLGPSWSPKGDRVAFYSIQDFGCYLADLDGSNRKLLLRSGPFSGIAWSPDGTRLATMTTKDRPNGMLADVVLVITDLEGKPMLQRPLGLYAWGCSVSEWTKDNTIVFSSYNEALAVPQSIKIYAVRSDGTHLRRMTDDETRCSEGFLQTYFAQVMFTFFVYSFPERAREIVESGPQKLKRLEDDPIPIGDVKVSHTDFIRGLRLSQVFSQHPESLSQEDVAAAFALFYLGVQPDVNLGRVVGAMNDWENDPPNVYADSLIGSEQSLVLGLASVQHRKDADVGMALCTIRVRKELQTLKWRIAAPLFLRYPTTAISAADRDNSVDVLLHALKTQDAGTKKRVVAKLTVLAANRKTDTTHAAKYLLKKLTGRYPS